MTEREGGKVISLHDLRIVLPGEREMDKMQFGNQLNPFQSTILYLSFTFFFFTKYRYKNDIDDRQKITHLLNIGVISMYLLETQVWKNVGIQDTAFEMKNPYLLLNAVFYKLYLATQKHNIWHWKAKATYIFSTFIVGTLFIAY